MDVNLTTVGNITTGERLLPVLGPFNSFTPAHFAEPMYQEMSYLVQTIQNYFFKNHFVFLELIKYKAFQN